MKQKEINMVNDFLSMRDMGLSSRAVLAYMSWMDEPTRKSIHEISTDLGLSKPTVVKCIKELVKKGFVLKGEQEYDEKGKRIPLTYKVDSSKLMWGRIITG